MKEPLRDRIARAIVTFPHLGGRGVLVPGHFIVTAAHLFPSEVVEGMFLGDYSFEEMVAADGSRHWVAPLAIEVVEDIAVLGVDKYASHEPYAEAFEAWCKRVPAVPLQTAGFRLGAPYPAYVFTHDQGVVAVKATQYFQDVSLAIRSPVRIERGTSGSPVVTPRGLLLGIVSTSAPGKTESDASVPRINFAVPTWLVRQMMRPGIQRKLDAALPPGRHEPVR